MTNRIIASILLLALLSANLSGLFIYAEFKANQKSIAATLCENRDKPEMHCEGKCYLMKKLKDAVEKETKKDKEAQKKGWQLISIIQTPEVILFLSFKQKKERPIITSFQLPEISSEIPHPPPSFS